MGVLPQDDAWLIAQNALAYARGMIVKGSTRLENNALDSHKFTALMKGVEDVRVLNDNGVGEYGQIADYLVIPREIEEYKSDIDFYLGLEAHLAVTAHYSLGNCGELAHHAYDYVLNNANQEKVFAEIADIGNGDHMFLMLNREYDDDSSAPETWGEGAIICDPWANKVYFASEYKTQLENFLSIGDGNFTAPFDPSVHQICFSTPSTRFIAILQELLCSQCFPPTFQKLLGEVRDGIGIVATFHDKLAVLVADFKAKYPKSDKQLIEIQKKINELAVAKEKMESLANHINKDLSHVSAREQLKLLMETRRKHIQLFNQATRLSAQSKEILLSETPVTKFLSLFSDRQSYIKKRFVGIAEEMDKEIKAKFTRR